MQKDVESMWDGQIRALKFGLMHTLGLCMQTG